MLPSSATDSETACVLANGAVLATHAQLAIKNRDNMLLELIAGLRFDPKDEHSPVLEAAKDVWTLPVLWQLVKSGANLDPIWPMLRSELKLRWLLCLLFDTFFEQGLRCRAPRCSVYKLASPDIRSIIISFLWSGLRRPSTARAAAIGERHRDVSKSAAATPGSTSSGSSSKG